VNAMKNKRKRDTTVNLSDWDIETRMGYLTSLGYESNQTEEEEKARVEVYRWNETYNMMLKSMKLKRKD
jgi:predicted lactoylglutathione lyase